MEREAQSSISFSRRHFPNFFLHLTLRRHLSSYPRPLDPVSKASKLPPAARRFCSSAARGTPAGRRGRWEVGAAGTRRESGRQDTPVNNPRQHVPATVFGAAQRSLFAGKWDFGCGCSDLHFLGGGFGRRIPWERIPSRPRTFRKESKFVGDGAFY